MHKSHTHYKYHIHTNTHITQNNTTKIEQNKEKQSSSQSYANSEGQITANEYRAEKGEEIKLSLGGLLSCETSRPSHCLYNRFILGG
jgi:hypothetical protein